MPLPDFACNGLTPPHDGRYSQIGHTHGGGSQAFPVGSVFLSVVATDPATLLGYGTWARIAVGKMLVGQDPGDADFDVAEETGGAKSVGHSGAAVADHAALAHSGAAVADHAALAHSGTAVAAHTVVATKQGTAAGNVVTTATHSVTQPANHAAQAHGVTQPANHAAQAHGVTQPAAHSVLNPYFVLYVWKRTA